ncbi:Os08g0381000, partial [Oryza sativa Japonica Group]
NGIPSLRYIVLAPSRDLPWSLATSPPSSPLSRAAGRLQPPLSPCLCVGWPRHHLSRPRSRLLSHGLPSVSRGDRRRLVPAVALLFPPRWPPPAAFPASPVRRPAVPSPPSALQHRPLHRPHRLLAGNSPERCPRRQPVALVPLYSLQPAAVRRRCADRRRRLLLRHRGIVSFPGVTSSSPEARRSGLLVGVQYLPVSGRLLYVAGAPIDVAISSVDVAALSSPPAAPLFRRNAVARAGLHPHRRRRPFGRPVHPRRLVVSRCRLRHRICSGAFHVVPVSVQLPPAALVVSSPAPVVVVVLIVVAFVPPSSRSRPSSAFVKCAAAAPSSSSSSAPRRQASCRPRLAFVQGSPPKPSPRRSSPLCPSVSAAPVRRCRSHASSRGEVVSLPDLLQAERREINLRRAIPSRRPLFASTSNQKEASPVNDSNMQSYHIITEPIKDDAVTRTMPAISLQN